MNGARTCPTCLALVSVRTQHSGRACFPPQPFEPSMVRWSTDPPFQAWPADHVHRRSGRPSTLTSPFPDVAAGALVALARHQSSDPRAPTREFQRLLQAGQTDVLHELRAPRPALVWCKDAAPDIRHRLQLVDGRLTAVDHPGVDPEAETIAHALGGVELPGCVRLLIAWQNRAFTMLRRAGLWHLLVLDAARRWAEVGEPAEQRDGWITRAIGPQEVAHGRALGMPEEELARWSQVADAIGEVAQWWRSEWTVREAYTLSLCGIGVQESARWRAQGLDVKRLREGREVGLDPDVAGRWYAAGWSLAAAAEMLDDRGTLEQAEALRVASGRRAGVPALLRSGLTPSSVTCWRSQGRSVSDLVSMAKDGLVLDDLAIFGCR